MSKIGFKELSLALVDKYGLEREAAEQFVEKMFDVLSKGIETDRQVKVKGLGTFKVVPVASRKSVDVNTGEPIVIEGRDKVSFTPDSAMRELVNRPFSQFETVPINDGVDFTAIDEHFANVEEGTEDIIMTDNDETVTEPITTDATKQDDKMAETSEGEAASGATNVLGTQPDETASTKNDETETTYGEGIDDHSTHQGGTPEETVVAAETVVSDNEPIQTTEPMKPEESFTPVAPGSEPIEETTPNEANGPSHPTEETTNDEKDEVSESINDAAAPTNATSEQTNEDQPRPTSSTKTTAEMVQTVSETEREIDDARNQVILMQREMVRHNRFMRWFLGISAFLLLACVASIFYLAMQISQRDHRIEHLEAAAILASRTPQGKAILNASVDSAAVAQAKKDSLEAARKLQEDEGARQKMAEAEQAKAKQVEQEASKRGAEQAERAKKEDAAKKANEAAAKQKAQQAKPTEAKNNSKEQNKYNKDVRIRTGAYTIIGIDRTVTAKAGQTLAGISRTQLGPGMECYIEAVNPGRKQLKAGDKVNIPKLKLKKKN